MYGMDQSEVFYLLSEPGSGGTAGQGFMFLRSCLSSMLCARALGQEQLPKISAGSHPLLPSGERTVQPGSIPVFIYTPSLSSGRGAGQLRGPQGRADLSWWCSSEHSVCGAGMMRVGSGDSLE